MPVALAVSTQSYRRPPAPHVPVTVTPLIDHDRSNATHEVASLHAASRLVAGLLGCSNAIGGADPASSYWLPARTLLQDEARLLGIEDESQLWGGVVPHAFVGTKLVSHPLWPGGSGAPAGWRDVPGIEACTLPGWSVFNREDARAACRALLTDGPVRFKNPWARGGNDQVVFDDARAAQDWLDAAIGLEHGLVVERDLSGTVTYGVGSARIGEHAIAYFGTQSTVRDHRGHEVYGGSRLTVLRGDLAQLCTALPDPGAREAVCTAMHYDRAVRGCYRVLASRCNYDVIVGEDRDRRRHCGVLEQSWRFGGASMAELLAMERFAREPDLHWLVAETVESYDRPQLPAGAVEIWPGDAESPCKYARIVDDGY
ncbi:MAG TPA: DUF3182 family protein [Luteimonas sp.]|nr:DUF3182 family protein [Luteimonas sp.]